MGKRTQNSKIYDIALFLMAFIWITIVIANAGLVIKIPVQSFYPIIAAIVCAIALYFISERDLRHTAWVFIASVIIIILFTWISGYLHDYSWDGNAYHKTTLGLIRDGWNPIYTSFTDIMTQSDTVHEFDYPIWYSAYTRGWETFGACIYALTGRIDSGKSSTILAIIAVICVYVTLLKESGKFKLWQGILVSLVLVVNPVTLPQMLSYYNDTFMGMCVFLLVASLLYLSFKPEGSYKKRSYIMIFLVINIAINVKMSGIVHMAVFCAGFFILHLVREIRKDRSIKKSLKQILFYIVTLVSSFCVTGVTCYVRNIAVYKNPFYTMLGEGKINIVSAELPSSYETMSHIERFIRSTFSAVNNTMYAGGEQPHFKIPFTTDESEWVFVGFDIRISGWGIFFSGILIISAIILGLGFVRLMKSKSTIKGASITLFLSTFVPVFFVPALCWARYFMQYFFVPAAALLYLFYCMNRRKLSKKTITLPAVAACVLGLALILNCSPMVLKFYKYVSDSVETESQLKELLEISETNNIEISLVKGRDNQGILYNLRDAGITNYTYTYGQEDGVEYTIVYGNFIGWRYLN